MHAEFYRELLDTADDMDLPIEGLHEETGPGVIEAAIAVDEALDAADKAALFKTFTKVHRAAQRPAWRRSWPSGRRTGRARAATSTSRCKSARPASRSSTTPAEPHGMSDAMRQFVGGQQTLMPELLAMVAPTVNSYPRLIPGFWAPTDATWGVENRTTALRVIPGSAKSQRVEYRIAAADANPYLALAAALGSGLWGIENQVEPEPADQRQRLRPASTRARLALPRTLWEAAQRLKALEGGARLVRRRVRRALRRHPRVGGARVPQAHHATGNWHATSRSSDRARQPSRLAVRQHADTQCISPVDGRVYVERPLADAAQIEPALERARARRSGLARSAVGERAPRSSTRFCDAFESQRDAIAEELSWQMGRPIRYAPGEVRGFERARAPHDRDRRPRRWPTSTSARRPGFTRFIRREPLGVGVHGRALELSRT